MRVRSSLPARVVVLVLSQVASAPSACATRAVPAARAAADPTSWCSLQVRDEGAAP